VLDLEAVPGSTRRKRLCRMDGCIGPSLSVCEFDYMTGPSCELSDAVCPEIKLFDY
jgi:hypothetical protein